MQSYAKSELGRTILPAEMQELLVETGIASDPEGWEGITVPKMPNIRAAIEYLKVHGGITVPDPDDPENPDPENPDPENPDPELINLTIHRGSGSGQYPKNSSITIIAEPAHEDSVFDYWSAVLPSDNALIEDPTSSSTVITIGRDYPLMVTAIYRSDESPLQYNETGLVKINLSAAIRQGALQLSIPQAGTYSIILHDVRGQIVQQVSKHLTYGSHRIPLKTTTAGLYIIRVENSAGLQYAIKQIIR